MKVNILYRWVSGIGCVIKRGSDWALADVNFGPLVFFNNRPTRPTYHRQQEAVRLNLGDIGMILGQYVRWFCEFGVGLFKRAFGVDSELRKPPIA